MIEFFFCHSRIMFHYYTGRWLGQAGRRAFASSSTPSLTTAQTAEAPQAPQETPGGVIYVGSQEF